MKIVILYSGGLDSFLMKKYAEIKYPSSEIVFIYYKHGAESEEEEIRRLPKYVDIREVEWLNDKRKPVSKKDDPYAGNIYIPGRNLIFSSLAACQELPNEIWMGTLWDEDNFKATDKNEFFRSSTSSLLSYVLSPFLDGVKVRFPFVDEGWTKLDCIQWALSNGVSKDDIKSTVSCWNQKGDKPCGVCKQCFKRKLNFLLSNIDEDYIEDPLNSDHGRKLLEMYLLSNDEMNEDEKNIKKQILSCYHQNLFDEATKKFITPLL